MTRSHDTMQIANRFPAADTPLGYVVTDTSYNGHEEDIFYAGGPTGSSGHDIFEAWYRNGHWQGPADVTTTYGFPRSTSTINVAIDSAGIQYVFYRCTDGDICEGWYTSKGWNFKNFHGWMTWSQVSVTVNSYNDIQTISYEGGNGDVYTTYYLPYYGWTSPQDMTQGFSLPKTDAGPSITINPNGVFYFYARARNGTIFEYWPEGTGLFSWQPGPTMGVGVYVGTAANVNRVFADHWTSPETVSGICGTYIEDVQDGYACAQMVTPSGNVTCPGNGQISYTIDQYTECDLAHFNYNDFWLSFWTIGAPTSAANCINSSSDPNNPDYTGPYYCAGYTAGYNAAGEMLWAARHPSQGGPGPYLPSYAVLDMEGWNSVGTATWTPTNSEIQPTVNGWADGVRAATLLIQPAYYETQSPIINNGLPTSLSYALIPAITSGYCPNCYIISENTSDTAPVENPVYTTSAVAGYAAYYAKCSTPPGTTGTNDSADVSDVEGWGRAYNTVQFNPSGYNPPSEVPCGP